MFKSNKKILQGIVRLLFCGLNIFFNLFKYMYMKMVEILTTSNFSKQRKIKEYTCIHTISCHLHYYICEFVKLDSKGKYG